MKKILILTAILMSTIAVRAQREEGDFTMQPKVGMNLSNLSDADKPIVELNFGIEGEYMLTDHLSLAASILVSNQGAKYDSDKNGRYTVDLDYVNVPIVANYYVLPGLAIKAGVQPGFRLKAKGIEDGASYDWDELLSKFNNTLGENVKISRFDIGIPVGLSYEYKNIVLDARYNWGLIKVVNTGDAFYNRVFQLTLGYKFCLTM